MDATLITLDIDWAPDFAIDVTARLLADLGVRATWLVTHASPAVRRLADRPELFELGIHPNFGHGSSHGASPEAVLDHCLALVPDARTVRTHSLVQSTPLLDLILARTTIEADLSIFLPYATNIRLVPYTRHGRTIFRVPYLWEDDYEFAQPTPDWGASARLVGRPGVRVFNFHPIHVYLNSCSGGPYAELKHRVRSLAEAEENLAAPLICPGEGTRTLFEALVGHIARHGGGLRVRDLVEENDPAPAAGPSGR